jgi:hypothetical protein
VALISVDVMLKTIVGHFFGDHDAYMTTELPDINGCIPDKVMISGSGSSPSRGTSGSLKPLPELASSQVESRLHDYIK